MKPEPFETAPNIEAHFDRNGEPADLQRVIESAVGPYGNIDHFIHEPEDDYRL